MQHWRSINTAVSIKVNTGVQIYNALCNYNNCTFVWGKTTCNSSRIVFCGKAFSGLGRYLANLSPEAQHTNTPTNADETRNSHPEPDKEYYVSQPESLLHFAVFQGVIIILGLEHTGVDKKWCGFMNRRSSVQQYMHQQVARESYYSLHGLLDSGHFAYPPAAWTAWCGRCCDRRLLSGAFPLRAERGSLTWKGSYLRHVVGMVGPESE